MTSVGHLIYKFYRIPYINEKNIYKTFDLSENFTYTL
jgi:hypothetical protein